MSVNSLKIALAALALSLSQVIAAPTSRPTIGSSTGWTLSRPELGFSVKVPAPAKYADEVGVYGTTHSWLVNANGTILQIGVGDLNTLSRSISKTEKGRNSILDGLIKGYYRGLINSSGATVPSIKLSKDYRINGYRAGDYSYLVLAHEGRISLEGRTLFCVTDHYTYTFSTISPSKSDPTVATFFDSIKIR